MKLPIKFDEILLPKKSIDMKKWCVVACDQFTSQTEYWEELKDYVGNDYSALNLIFPECYLSQEPEKRIQNIIAHMKDYLSKDIFRTVGNGLVLLERKTPLGNVRHGLTMIVDLTQYSFNPADKALIRATEGTVVERIPPRVKIRENCPLELPHIMLLIDDPERTVIEPLLKNKNEVLYDTDLNMNGGHITGWSIKDSKPVESALQKLLDDSVAKYGEPLLFAVGDGNHSLATAKACYNENNPLSKYALVEVANIYDEGILFEPIHRLIMNVDNEKFLKEFQAQVKGTQKSKLFVGNSTLDLYLPADSIDAVAQTQAFIDSYLKANGGEIDYIHGEEDLRKLCAKTGGIGIVLKSMEKSSLFDYIVKNGVLPRKTFSMGEANEKRYYIEARKIK